MFLKFNHCAYSMHLTSEYKVLFGKQTHAVQLLYHPPTVATKSDDGGHEFYILNTQQKSPKYID